MNAYDLGRHGGLAKLAKQSRGREEAESATAFVKESRSLRARLEKAESESRSLSEQNAKLREALVFLVGPSTVEGEWECGHGVVLAESCPESTCEANVVRAALRSTGEEKGG